MLYKVLFFSFICNQLCQLTYLTIIAREASSPVSLPLLLLYKERSDNSRNTMLTYKLHMRALNLHM